MDARFLRRLTRFRLRTAFFAVTIFCGWLGWQVSIIRERRQLLQETKSWPSFHVAMAQSYEESVPPGMPPHLIAKIPIYRRWLGDEAVQEFWYYDDQPKTNLDRLVKAFPEAKFHQTLPIPCHPGCFPHGTNVHTPSGPVAIESLKAGDIVTTIRPDFSHEPLKIQSIFATENQLWRIVTEAGTLVTTGTQPLCVAPDKTVPAKELSPGEQILFFRDGQFRGARILQIIATTRNEKVFNLVLGDKEVFIANGFLARSKPPLNSTNEVVAE